MSYPKVVALDTDWTIWQQFLDHGRWGKGRGAVSPVEDNIERVDRSLLRDKSNHANWIRVYNDVSNVVHDILKNGAQLAIVSRNPSKAMCDRSLHYFNTTNPSNGREWSIIHLVKYDEVVNEPKVNHFRRIQKWSGSDYSDMLLYDDEALNNSVKVELGVAFEFLRNRGGLTWDAYQRGIETWRRAKRITIPSGIQPKRRIIGYSGLPTQWIDLVRKREGTVDTKIPYRWGYALYVAPSVALAKFFRDWARSDGHEAYVCEVWVKDYDAWAKINKIWVPEDSSFLPQMDNQNWSAEQTGRNQENRDRTIANRWGVHTPYVLFSRHKWMPGIPNPPHLHRWRFSEMVVYTQIQRALFEVVPVPDARLNQIANPAPHQFRFHFKEWSIRVPNETREEFRRRREMEFYRLSA